MKEKVWFPKHQHESEIENRQRAMDAMMGVLEQNSVCPACGVSAALHIAAYGTIKLEGRSREEFLELADEIFKDVTRQLSNKPSA
jgi:hypothetical protein